jgi:hypothetical protein
MGEEYYAGLTIESSTLIYVERSRHIQGRFYGPFHFLRVSQHEIYTSYNRRMTLARFNRFDREWHIAHDNSHGPRMLILPTGQTLF